MTDLLVKNSKVDGRGGLKERGSLLLKREGILERRLIEYLQYMDNVIYLNFY